MSTPAIRVRGLGKEYRLGGTRAPRTARDMLTGMFRGGPKAGGGERFWALRDIDFDVQPGEVVGIIGRNGAGKSTLLKILSRIVPMSTGRVELRGRVGSLLEVGTGFHSELSGRENIFLNGAILGMRRREIQRKFDEIVAFAEVERFLDTPVKHYSSGMYVRLAFSVAAHLEPEILIVDEVLAVGDAMFQRKCLGKMQDVSSGGRTVLFVSHQMETVERLCTSAIVLEQGQVAFEGHVRDAIDRYLAVEAGRFELADRGAAPDSPMRLRTARVLGARGASTSRLVSNEEAWLELEYDVNQPVRGAHVVCHVTDPQGHIIISTGDRDIGDRLDTERAPGRYRSRFALPTDLLNDGRYGITIALGVPYGVSYDRVADAMTFDLVEVEDAANRPAYLQRRPGMVVRNVAWETQREGAP